MRAPRGGRDARASPEGRLLAGLVALQLEPALAGPLLKYLGELVLWNKAYNLTAVRDPAAMVTRHLLDSLALLPLVEGRTLDVGSGAGLPGIPLALANPALHVTLLDSNGKKTRFLRHVQRALALTNVEIVEARAEKYEPAARFDTVVTRAFGSLAEFFAAAARLCAPAGRLVAMKGKLDATETAAIPADIEIKEIRRLTVPGLDEERHAVIAARGA
jgi:16S rRNA (guanine527-N7)-methyltransferase